MVISEERTKKIIWQEWLLPALLLALSLFKFYKLGGGINLGEPDEFIHADVAASFSSGPWPHFSGGYWFFELPLYPFLGYLTSLLFPGRYLGLRIVSVAFSLLLTLGIYFYLKYKVSKRVGFFSALIFVLSPMAVYYSRLGLLDMATTAAAMLFLFSLDLALARRSLFLAALSGFFLGTSLLVKYSALIYLLLLLFIWALLTARENFSDWRFSNWLTKFREKKTLELEAKTTLSLLIVSLLVIPLALVLRAQNPYLFKLQLLTSLGFIRDFWRIKGGELTLGHYGTDIVWWISWPIFFLVLIGSPVFLKRWRSFAILLLGFISTLLFIFPHTPFYPRYFFPLIPFLALFAGLGLDCLLSFLDPSGLKTALKGLFLALVGVLILPASVEAWLSSDHSLIEDTGIYIREQKKTTDPWIFANYWPNYFGSSAQSSWATWLTASAWDAGAYVGGLTASPLELLDSEGGFVVLEKLYSDSPIFIHNSSRWEAWQRVREKYQPVQTIYDPSPNFPHFHQKVNYAAVYKIGLEEK